MSKISVVIITRNEESRIRTALASVRALADEIIVVDDFSDDATCQIAQKEFSARIFARRSDRNLAGQRNFGVDQSSYDWILQMDADEVFPPETVQAAREALASAGDTAAFSFMRLNHFTGHPVRHAGAYHPIVRLYRKDRARYDEPAVHEVLKIKGEQKHIPSDICHYAIQSVAQIFTRTIHYTSFEAVQYCRDKEIVSWKEIRYGLTGKALKNFFKIYIKKQGYKDGRHGLIWCICNTIGPQIRWLMIWDEARRTNRLGA